MNKDNNIEINIKKARLKFLLNEQKSKKKKNNVWNFIAIIVLLGYFGIGILLLFNLGNIKDNKDIILYVVVPLAILLISYILNLLMRILQDRENIERELFEILSWLKVRNELDDNNEKEFNKFIDSIKEDNKNI